MSKMKINDLNEGIMDDRILARFYRDGKYCVRAEFYDVDCIIYNKSDDTYTVNAEGHIFVTIAGELKSKLDIFVLSANTELDHI